MSKEAAQRAMREANYARRAARPGTPARRPASPPAAASAPMPTTTSETSEPVVPATEGLCGHRSMNGRTCTREQGHAAKSHRYS